ncbi:MAG: hypothetical protein E7413_00845 [Ruminococcaceae bacterium]|nr:hypothetical protein [Oscillospiraceae bacterium]
MKKLLAIIFVCILFMTSATAVGASYQLEPTLLGFPIVLNGESLDCSSAIFYDIHYVPLRKVFENLGAKVFYRSSDRQILALTRDGDMIRHVVGDYVITINGVKRIFDVPSVLWNNETYLPIDMVVIGFGTDALSYDNELVSIQKYMFHNNYHKIIKDVLDVSHWSNFYPEKFQRYVTYHERVPSYSMDQILYRVNLGLDYPFYENVVTVKDPYALLVLVNKYNQLPSNFTQYNLVHMNPGYTIRDGKEYLLAGVTNENYALMADAAARAGLSMKVVSAYRTESYQRGLYNNKVRSSGKTYADNYSARPGHSEHQTGLAVDINSTKVAFEYSGEFKWLQQHAHEYGFIMRYPKGKEWITGYAYEPWHYRYVGREAAQIIHDEGITYEEYYVKYVDVNEFR